jgi:glycosyltransferase involved in cell wall biosynthesis
MKTRHIVITAAQVPFHTGGAEWHVEALRLQLAARGYTVEVVQLPFQWTPREEALRSALSWRLLDFTHAGGIPIDLVIGTRFPSYAARHPNKIVWLFHQFRQAYDLHDSGVDGFADTPEGRTLRARFVEMDTRLLNECRRIFTTSTNNAERLHRYNGLAADVLRLPLLDPESYRSEGFEGFVLSVGRLDALKRTERLLRAAELMRSGARVVIVGDGPERASLERQAAELDVAGRVRFLGRVDEATLKDLYARCSVVYYAPHDEDYGLVTLEAFQSGKPVVTTVDAGGPLEFVRPEETGLVAADDAGAIAAALDRLVTHETLARDIGERARESIRGIRWDPVIDALTETLR